MFNLKKKDKERDSMRKDKKKERMSAAELRSLEEMSMRRGFFNLKREAKRESKNKIEISNPIPIKVASGSELTLTDIESDGLSIRSNRSSVVLDGQLSGASSTDDLKGEASQESHRGSVRDRVAHFGSLAKNSSQVGQMMKRFSFSQRSKEESPSEGSTPSGPNSAAPSPQVEGKVINMLRKHSLKQPPGNPPPDPPCGPPGKRPCIPELVPKTFPAHLHLPPVNAPVAPQTRELELQRRNTGDFGFSLRRTTMLDRSPDGGVYRRVVHFAEPGAGTKDLALGLVPGDRLVEINGRNVENKSRDEIVEMIRQSGDTVRLKVQPILELSELSRCWLRNTEGLRRDARHELSDALSAVKAQVYEYVFVDGSMTWTDAQRFCREHYTDLATIDNLEEMRFFPRPAQNTEDIWIGLRFEYAAFVKWRATYPREGECPAFLGTYEWATSTCADAHWFLCTTGAGIRYMTFHQSYSDAQTNCKEQAKELAIIRSESAYRLVISIIQSDVEASSNPEGVITWVNDPPGAWVWSDHRPVHFTNWQSGNPRDLKYSSCAAVGPDNYWRDRNCDQSRAAFCYRRKSTGTY
ncbi:hypothetical protein WMY93_028893 [Mugilogobius chulae]|uniref:PDZ domain-containing protein n=1 Tax=Mugilogobius chulae TaxID=88201 RepID=A0AAW0MTS1_9GOBI